MTIWHHPYNCLASKYLTAAWQLQKSKKIQWQLPVPEPDYFMTTHWWFLMTAWCIYDNSLMAPDDCQKTTWRLPDDCLTTAWRLPDNCLTTAWQLPNDLQLPNSSDNCIKSMLNKHKKSFSPQWQITPPRTPRISRQKSQILKPTFLS